MIRIKFVVLTVVLFIAAASCSKKESSEQTVQSTDSLTSMQNEVLVPADAPAWYSAKPDAPGFLYGRGMARSSRVNIARDKAILKAQAELAELLKSDSALTVPVELKNTLIKEQRQIREGKQWRVYVLLETSVSDTQENK